METRGNIKNQYKNYNLILIYHPIKHQLTYLQISPNLRTFQFDVNAYSYQFQNHLFYSLPRKKY